MEKTYEIAFIDDKDYGIPQVLSSIPKWMKYNFHYFDSYKKALNKHYDIVLLDYYLDKDFCTWEDIVEKLDFWVLISFSSVDSCNEKITKKIKDSYWVRKLFDNKNKELEEVFGIIFFSYT